VTPLAEHGEPPDGSGPLEFAHRNHDDVLRIVQMMQGSMQSSSNLDADAAASHAVGLKPLSETVLQHKHEPLFDVLRAPLHEFIQTLKSRRGY
jgi:hypothetical protein